MQLSTQALKILTAGKGEQKSVIIRPGIDSIVAAYQRKNRVSYSEALNQLVLFGSEAVDHAEDFQSE